MYEARQNKEKVSRRIDANGGGARQRVKIGDVGQWFIMQRKGIRCHFPIIQKARIATNVNCPSWGDSRPLGTYIHGLFQTQFLSGVGIGPVPPLIAPPPMFGPTKLVEVLTPTGRIADFALNGIMGWQYGELKPNTTAQINNGHNALLGLPLMPFVHGAPWHNSIPLRRIDYAALPQNAASTLYNQVQEPNGTIHPAPLPGTIPSIHIMNAGGGVMSYDAW